MLTANCDQIDQCVEEVRIDDRLFENSCFVATAHDTELDDLIPFYFHNTPVTWLGTERVFDEVAIENSEDIERRYAPGCGNPSDSIGVEFLSDAVALEKAGDIRASLAIIYRRVDEMTKLGMLQLLDDELLSVPPEGIGTDVLLGLLTATLPVKYQLPSRSKLFKITKRLLKTRGHYERGILDGLS